MEVFGNKTDIGNEYELKDIEVDGNQKAPERLGVYLSKAWSSLISEGDQLAAPEDYIEIVR